MSKGSARPGAAVKGDKDLQNPSLLLLRHAEEIRGSSVLVVGYPDDNFGPVLREQQPQTPVTFFNFDYAAHRNLRARFAAAGPGPERLVFDSWYAPPAEPHDLVLVYLPKSRALIEMTLMMVAGATPAGAAVWLVGENNAGIRSSRQTLEEVVGEVVSSDAARHCVLYKSARGVRAPARTRLDEWFESFAVEARGLTLEVKSLPGVFSHGRLDAGTSLLLENLEPPPPGARVLDFGAGAGVIGLAVKRLQPEARLDMVDSSALALESSRRTMAAAAFPETNVYPSDVLSDVKGSYARILSNPPFHTGVHTDYRMVEEFIKESAAHLEKKGTLTVVANRFLKYQPLLEKHLGACRVVAENNSYRVYEAGRA